MKIKESAEIEPGLSVRLGDIEAVTGEASGPGEVGGPAIRFTVTLTNGGADGADLTSTVVNVFYGAAETPGLELREPGGKPFPTTVAAGGKASGTFVFGVPAKERDDVLITVDFAADRSVIAFRGKVPG